MAEEQVGITVAMDSEAKIDMINAYRQLQGKTLSLGKSTPEGVAAGVNSEFQAWIKGKIEEYLGSAPAGQKAPEIPASQLTDDDVAVLLALVDNVRSKQRLGRAAAGDEDAEEAPRQPRHRIRGPELPARMRGNPNARPLIEGPVRPADPDPDGMKRRNGQAALLRELAHMDQGFDPDA